MKLVMGFDETRSWDDGAKVADKPNKPGVLGVSGVWFQVQAQSLESPRLIPRFAGHFPLAHFYPMSMVRRLERCTTVV